MEAARAESAEWQAALDDIDGDEDVANVYDEVGGFFVFVFSSQI